MPKVSKSQAALPAFDLKSEREKHDMTQAEAAQMLFTTQSSIARWEIDGDMPQIHREYWKLFWKNVKVPKKQKAATEAKAA